MNLENKIEAQRKRMEQEKRKNMNDYIVRATAADHSIRAFAITSKNIVEEARKDHNTSPVITAALGRLLSGAAMMGTMMKGEKDLLTVQIQCQGPAQGLTVTADSAGHVKGFPRVADVELPPNALGKLDVGGALGLGVMSVIKDMGLKEPYVGQIALQTGEIAEDLTYYFATSEQVPSAVGLGVLVDVDGSVKQAGGFIIQLMPFTPDEVVDALEKKISEDVYKRQVAAYAVFFHSDGSKRSSLDAAAHRSGCARCRCHRSAHSAPSAD